MNTLVIDPGLRGVGLSYFVDAVLAYAVYVKNPILAGGGPKAWFALADAIYFDFKIKERRVDEFVMEVPQVYRVSKGDPNDLIEIAAVGAAIGAMFPIERATAYRPREWKGSVRKNIHQPRILAALTPEERAVITETRKTVVHNIIDAVGIGLFHLVRTQQRKETWTSPTKG